MLTIKHGDMFTNLPAEFILAHGCNCKGVMGSGVAKVVKDKWPAAFTKYVKDLKNGCSLGYASIAKVGEGQVVANIFTQNMYGRNPDIVYVDYAAVLNGLLGVKKFAYDVDLPVHFPFIGGGLANGDRIKLLNIFNEVFDGEDVDATLWIN